MKQIILKPFQEKAVRELIDEFLHKWKKESRQTIRFEAPTGAGKTVMMAQFVKELVNDPRLTDANLAFLWASIGGSKEGNLASQSRKKFEQYYDGNASIEISSLDDLHRDKVLGQNEILFFNWSKIKTANKDGRKLRRSGESEITWDGMLERTKLEERNVILIIDEAHREARSQLAEEEIDLISPRIIIKVTATHDKGEEIEVKVEYEDVVNAGLIKEGILSQTREDFENKGEEDIDRYVLELALNKRQELAKIYKENNINVNPLLMIQLPNDEKKSQEERTHKEIVLGYLKEKGVDENKIAIWLDKEKKNLENITKNDNRVDVLLFKQAPATGWDAPRAQVLLMYREIKSPVFQVQLLGRVLRMPEAKKYTISILNHSYLYTTYTKNEIIDSYEKFKGGIGPNQAKIYEAHVKEDVEQIELKTFVSQRTSYNDLGKSFQFTFIDIAKRYFKSKKDLEKVGFFASNQHLDLNLIVDQKITDYDNFIKNLKKSIDFGVQMSLTDIEKLYKRLCIEILLRQEEDSKFGGIVRSYGVLKSAINVFLEDKLKVGTKEYYYPFIVNDLIKGTNSILVPVINKALAEYKPIRKQEEREKEKRINNTVVVRVPLSKIQYSALFKKIDSKKCAMKPCYVDKSNKNEMEFIEYLEGNNAVIWWYKNGNHGANYFSVKREDGKLFFPDWFIKTKDTIWIIDTKSGFTAEGEGAKIRARALKKWLSEHKDFKGGLVKPGSVGIWQIAKSVDLKEWEGLRL